MKFVESPYVIAEAIPNMSQEELVELLRGVRDAYLSQSDWTQLPDSPLTDQKKSEWAVYRQQLRDIVETSTANLIDTVFPTPPEGT
jgi:hypothetical protein